MSADTVDDASKPSYSYSRRRLYFSVFVGMSLFTGVGFIMGWASPALVLLKSRHFTSQQATLLASLPSLAPGPLITVFGIDLIGRKYSLLLIWSLLMTSWILMCISTGINTLLAARFIGGLGMSAAYSVIGIYTSEISDVHVRGALNSLSMVFISIGITIMSSVGPYTSIDVITIVSLVVTSIFGFFFFFIPESPYHLVNKGKLKQAQSTLAWLRVNVSNQEVEDELKAIQFSIEKEKKNKDGIRKLFTSKVVLKQFGIAWYILYLQQLSGTNPLAAYNLTIFKSAELPFDARYIPIALALFAVVAGFPSPYLVRKLGNKKLFIITTFALALGHGLMALYFFLLEGGHDVSSITWLPILATFYLIAVAFCGFGGVIWGVISDLFAPSVKGYATGICGIFSTFLGFLSTELFGLSKDAYHFGPTFLGYSILLIISSLGLHFVPNLTHMSLQEIQDYFEGKNDKSEKEEISE